VTPQLIDRVRSGNWNPARDQAGRQQRDAFAARGYGQAFQVVKSNVAEIVGGSSPGLLVRASHRDGYRELFAPRALTGLRNTGLMNISDLASYWNNAAYLRHSRPLGNGP
jgi:hypothetical protein